MQSMGMGNEKTNGKNIFVNSTVIAYRSMVKHKLHYDKRS